MSENFIWYKQSADKWESAIPIGNGTLGGMVFGKTDIERIQLNEDSLWYGGPMDRNNPETISHLDEMRQLIFDGKISEAEKLATTYLVGVPDGQRHYELLGDFYLDFDEKRRIHNYKRKLDLQSAITSVHYSADDISYEREYFSSYPDQVLVVHLKANASNSISFTSLFGRGSILEPSPWSDILIHPVGFQAYIDSITASKYGDMIVKGRSGGENGIRFSCGIRVLQKGGQVHYTNGKFIVSDADEATILITACTDFRYNEPVEKCMSRLQSAAAKGYNELRADHISDYQQLFNRVQFSLQDKDKDVHDNGSNLQNDINERNDSTQQINGNDNFVSTMNIPTDERLERIKTGLADPSPSLVSLYFNFGRYLLISSSRPGSLPANLQGIWNKDMLPIWDSKYTININTQMNYWLAETCNLSECHEPLFEFIERLKVNGTITAQTMYNCRGFVAHHNSDIWADTAPQDVCITSTFWSMGAAWLSLHLWDHYEFTGNKEFLSRAYETMKEAALFIVDFLIKDGEGQLVISPSSSPENRYILENGEVGALCYGASMDNQIITELFNCCIKSTEILNRDHQFAEELKAILTKIKSPAIGKNGTIQEWNVDYEELEPGHRHISHLFALHPGTQIGKAATPNLADAAKLTLERRLQFGGGHTGWSRAWILNMWARLEEAELAHDNIMELLRSSTLPNLFCDHPPFQIDGNFGGVAGIAEMLLQSHQSNIHLLPALPNEWKQGEISGLKARGGYTISITWDNHKLVTATITTIQSQIDNDREVAVTYQGKTIVVKFDKGQWTKQLILNDFVSA